MNDPSRRGASRLRERVRNPESQVRVLAIVGALVALILGSFIAPTLSKMARERADGLAPRWVESVYWQAVLLCIGLAYLGIAWRVHRAPRTAAVAAALMTGLLCAMLVLRTLTDALLEPWSENRPLVWDDALLSTLVALLLVGVPAWMFARAARRAP